MYPLAVVFAQSIETRCSVENEDVVGAAPTGDAPTTSELSTTLLPTKVRLILEVFRYYDIKPHSLVSGTAFGLNLVLNIEQYEYLPNAMTDAGVKVNSEVMNKHQWIDRRCLDSTRGVFDQIGLNEIVAWIINYIHGFVIHALTTMVV